MAMRARGCTLIRAVPSAFTLLQDCKNFVNPSCHFVRAHQPYQGCSCYCAIDLQVCYSPAERPSLAELGLTTLLNQISNCGFRQATAAAAKTKGRRWRYV